MRTGSQRQTLCEPDRKVTYPPRNRTARVITLITSATVRGVFTAHRQSGVDALMALASLHHLRLGGADRAHGLSL